MLSLDQLTKETIELTQMRAGQLSFLEEDILEESPICEMTEFLYPDHSGIIIDLERSGGTVKFHVEAVESLLKFRQNLDFPENFEATPDRLTEWLENKDQLIFFETVNFYRAELLRDQFNGKRFPLREEWLCNLSDPGFSWWLVRNDDCSVSIKFQSYGIDDRSRATKLGPIGDKNFTLAMLEKYQEQFKKNFDLASISFDQRSVTFHPKHKLAKNFHRLVDLLSTGENDESNLSSELLFLDELIDCRKLWIISDKQLEEHH